MPRISAPVPIPGHAPQPQVTVDIARVLSQDGLVVSLCLIEVAQGLAQMTEVVGYRHRDLRVVGLVLYGFLLATLDMHAM